VPEKKAYVVLIRSIETKNFLEAKFSKIPWPTLEKITDRIIKCSDVGGIYHGVALKPPETIEME